MARGAAWNWIGHLTDAERAEMDAAAERLRAIDAEAAALEARREAIRGAATARAKAARSKVASVVL